MYLKMIFVCVEPCRARANLARKMASPMIRIRKFRSFPLVSACSVIVNFSVIFFFTFLVRDENSRVNGQMYTPDQLCMLRLNKSHILTDCEAKESSSNHCTKEINALFCVNDAACVRCRYDEAMLMPKYLNKTLLNLSSNICKGHKMPSLDDLCQNKLIAPTLPPIYITESVRSTAFYISIAIAVIMAIAIIFVAYRIVYEWKQFNVTENENDSNARSSSTAVKTPVATPSSASKLLASNFQR